MCANEVKKLPLFKPRTDRKKKCKCAGFQCGGYKETCIKQSKLTKLDARLGNTLNSFADIMNREKGTENNYSIKQIISIHLIYSKQITHKLLYTIPVYITGYYASILIHCVNKL